MCCENSGILCIIQPHRNKNALNAKIEMAPGGPLHTFENLQVADGPSGAEALTYLMSLWDFGGSQSCIILGTPELSHQKFGTSEDAIWFDTGGLLEFPNDT